MMLTVRLYNDMREVAFAGYAPKEVEFRPEGGLLVAACPLDWPCRGGSDVVTHFTAGVFRGPITPNVAVFDGVTCRLTSLAIEGEPERAPPPPPALAVVQLVESVRHWWTPWRRREHRWP